ncbi:MAG: hypothetical protein ACR2LE_04110 [Nocardioidaceae bacterium]
MAQLVERPNGEVFLDARGNGRALRLTWHHESDLVVLSLWRDTMCAGTFRLAKGDVNEFVDALVEGLRDAPAAGLTSTNDRCVSGPEIGRLVPPPRRESETSDGSVPESFTDWAFGPRHSAAS